MAYTRFSGMSYVSADGNFNQCEDTLVFEMNELTEDQWATLDILPDYDKIHYALAILNGEDTSEWEE